jgi:hypothetical protein
MGGFAEGGDLRDPCDPGTTSAWPKAVVAWAFFVQALPGRRRCRRGRPGHFEPRCQRCPRSWQQSSPRSPRCQHGGPCMRRGPRARTVPWAALVASGQHWLWGNSREKPGAGSGVPTVGLSHFHGAPVANVRSSRPRAQYPLRRGRKGDPHRPGGWKPVQHTTPSPAGSPDASPSGGRTTDVRLVRAVNNAVAESRRRRYDGRREAVKANFAAATEALLAGDPRALQALCSTETEARDLTRDIARMLFVSPVHDLDRDRLPLAVDHGHCQVRSRGAGRPATRRVVRHAAASSSDDGPSGEPAAAGLTPAAFGLVHLTAGGAR